ncbi:MAG: hypothetical protein LAT56_08235 [Wenzhouxiangella sp.]|nr:hypothetical protein [Wenzhouxiangella sp.]
MIQRLATLLVFPPGTAVAALIAAWQGETGQAKLKGRLRRAFPDRPQHDAQQAASQVRIFPQLAMIRRRKMPVKIGFHPSQPVIQRFVLNQRLAAKP